MASETPLLLHRRTIRVSAVALGDGFRHTVTEEVGEQLTFGMEPSMLPEFLATGGLSLARDVGAAEYRALYFHDAARKMRGHEFYRIALARVAEAAAQRSAPSDAATRSRP